MKSIYTLILASFLISISNNLTASVFSASTTIAGVEQLDIEVAYRQSTGNVHFTITGPLNRWFAVAFNAPTMIGYTIEMNSNNGPALERTMLGIGAPGNPQNIQNLTNITFSISGGRITIEFDRSNITGDPMDYVFPDAASTIPIAWAMASSPSQLFSYHGFGTTQRAVSSLTFVQLPIKLSAFDISLDGSNSILNWTTETEIDSDGFEIQRSTDGESWEKLGYVRGQGQSSERVDYTFTDSEIYPGPNYYRLKMIDLDGSFEYSQILVVDYSGPSINDNILAYPTTTSDFVYLKSDEIITGNTRIMIFSTALQRVRDEFWAKEQQLVRLDLSDLPNGPYFIYVVNKQWRSSHRVMKVSK